MGSADWNDDSFSSSYLVLVEAPGYDVEKSAPP